MMIAPKTTTKDTEKGEKITSLKPWQSALGVRTLRRTPKELVKLPKW
jgi:hypothetical protein